MESENQKVPVRLEEGTLLNARYEIQSVIGQGGMGTVYLAKHLRLDTVVAVKEIRGEYTTEEERKTALQQLETEARFLVKLNHPNLPKVNDAFVENDRCYLIMEYIQGVTLEKRYKEANGPLDVIQVIEWALQITDVLGYLHNQNPPVVFRDLKPANIMVQPDGNVRLIDFGIARRFQPNQTKDTALFGSVGYSPPEQFGLHQTDTRADIYAFGATLHHLLTGRDPAVQPFKFPPANSLNPAIPVALSLLIEACLAIEPDKRPADIQAVALSLLPIRDALVAHPPVAPLPPPGASGETVVPVAAEGGQSGPKSGPKIISAKLAEAEAQKRRASGRRSPSDALSRSGQAASGATEAQAHSKTRVLVVVVCLLLLIGGTGLALVLTQKHPLQNKTGPKPNEKPAVTPPGKQPNGVNLPGGAGLNPEERDNPSGTPEDRASVTGMQITHQAMVNTQGVSVLQFHITGQIQGQANQTGKLAIFFYDKDSTPIKASDPKSDYANPEGQLSVAHPFQVATNDESFDVMMEIPFDQLGAFVNTGFKVRCRAFINHISIGATALLDIPPARIETPPSGDNGNTGADGQPNTTSPGSGDTSGNSAKENPGG